MKFFLNSALIGFISLPWLIAACESGQNTRIKDPRSENSPPILEPEETVSIEAVEADDELPRPLVSTFLRSHPGSQWKRSWDEAQALLINENEDMVVVGMTRSKLVKESMMDSSLAGDLFFARFDPGIGWQGDPIQVPVKPHQPIESSEDASSAPSHPHPPEALLRVRGGRILASGKALIAGEFDQAHFVQTPFHLEETAAANRNIFLAIFGSGSSGMIKSMRYGLAGDNTLAGVIESPKGTGVVMAGFTTAGLLKNAPHRVVSEVSGPSNFLAEVSDDGEVKRFTKLPPSDHGTKLLSLHVLASNSDYIFVASGRDDESLAFVRSFSMPDRRTVFLGMPERAVCADASKGALTSRVVAMDASQYALVVAVEIRTEAVGRDVVLPCVEVFDIQSNGMIVPRREVIFLKNSPTIAGTVRLRLGDEGKILMSRSREGTDGRGQIGVVVTHEWDWSDAEANDETRVWSLSRPVEGSNEKPISGPSRQVVAMHLPQIGRKNMAWIVSNDRTQFDEAVEVLTHIASYDFEQSKTE